MGMGTEKSRLQRGMAYLRDLVRRMRHLLLREQAINPRRVQCGKAARGILWEPDAGDRLRRPIRGGANATLLPKSNHLS
jgi:hypothetical protein